MQAARNTTTRRKWSNVNGERQINIVLIDMNWVELGSTRTGKGRFWRWRIRLAPKIRIRKIPLPKKMVLWVRDAYVRMMLGLAIIQSYKFLLMAHGALFVPRGVAATQVR
ncbi:hypothetical protein HKD37_15G044075 [Glycine soja]